MPIDIEDYFAQATEILQILGLVEPMQAKIKTVKAENENLRTRIAELEQKNRDLTELVKLIETKLISHIASRLDTN